MDYIMEHYGTGFLQMISGSILIPMLFSFLENEGVIQQIVVGYMSGICG